MWNSLLQKKFTLVLMAGLRLGYPENPALKPRKPSQAGFIIIEPSLAYVGLSWVSWVLKKYELGLAGFWENMSWD